MAADHKALVRVGALVALLVLLLALGLVWLFRAQPPAENAPPPPPAPSARVAPVAPAPPAVMQPSPPAAAPEPATPPPPPPSGRPIIRCGVDLTVADTEAGPMAAFPVRWAWLNRAGAMKLMGSPELAPQPELNWAETTTGEQGRCRLVVDCPDDEWVGSMFWFESARDGWTVAASPPAPFPLRPGLALFTARQKEEAWTLQVDLARTIRFEFYYADGQAVESGNASVSFYDADRLRIGSPLHLTVQPSRVFSVSVPRRLNLVKVTIHSVRRGFYRSHFAEIAAADLLAVNRVEVPPDPRQCALYIDLTQWPAGSPVEVTRRNNRGTVVDRAVAAPGSVALLLTRGDIIEDYLEAESPQGFWRGPLFNLKAPAERTFLALPVKTFAVRARFVDAAGKPVSRAGLALYYPIIDWSMERRHNPSLDEHRNHTVCCRAGKAGVAILERLPLDTTELFVDADRYEPQRLAVTGRAGEVVDLGDVVLQEAKGSVQFTLKGMAPGYPYSVGVLNPERTTVIEFVILHDDEATGRVERVPSGSYTVHVVAYNGERGKNVEIKLEPGSEPIVLEIDVSDLPLPAKKPEIKPKPK